jgi:hypothetical protein
MLRFACVIVSSPYDYVASSFRSGETQNVRIPLFRPAGYPRDSIDIRLSRDLRCGTAGVVREKRAGSTRRAARRRRERRAERESLHGGSWRHRAQRLVSADPRIARDCVDDARSPINILGRSR